MVRTIRRPGTESSTRRVHVLRGELLFLTTNNSECSRQREFVLTNAAAVTCKVTSGFLVRKRIVGESRQKKTLFSQINSFAKGHHMNTDPLDQKAPYAVSPPRYSVSHQMVTTAFELPNYRLVQNLGVVRGIVVRSRNVFATLGATIQTIVGGNITLWSKLCEQTRSDAFDIMIQHATEIGANAVIGARYDTTELS